LCKLLVGPAPCPLVLETGAVFPEPDMNSLKGQGDYTFINLIAAIVVFQQDFKDFLKARW
jgi:hypothetical protein